MNFRIILYVFTFCSQLTMAQEISYLYQSGNVSLRGLSVVSNDVVWASGSNGTVIRTTDGGKSFKVFRPTGYEKRDFRDVEAFDSLNAIIMAVDTPAIILKTTDGGQTWKKVFENRRVGMFLDAMDFYGSTGVVVGDPIEGKMFRAYTHDLGESWTIDQQAPTLMEGEAFFASSGSNVILLSSNTRGKQKAMKKAGNGLFVSGGLHSRFFLGDQSWKIPLQQGKNSTGANGLVLAPDAGYGFICGGDFASAARADSSMVLFEVKRDKVAFSFPATFPSGYKSAVTFVKPYVLLACGTSGVDLSTDNGKNWKKISSLPFHVCNAVYGSGKVWLAGPKGGIAVMTISR